MKADRDWLRRAERGPGVAGGPDRNRTAYFYAGGFHPYGASWGALVAGEVRRAESRSPTCFPVPTPDPSGVTPSFAIPDARRAPAAAALPCPPESPIGLTVGGAVGRAAPTEEPPTDRGADARPTGADGDARTPPPTEEPTPTPR